MSYVMSGVGAIASPTSASSSTSGGGGTAVSPLLASLSLIRRAPAPASSPIAPKIPEPVVVPTAPARATLVSALLAKGSLLPTRALLPTLIKPPTRPPAGTIPTPRLPMPGEPPATEVQVSPEGDVALAEQTKDWEGYSYRVMTPEMVSVLLSAIAQSPEASGSLPVHPDGTVADGTPIPAASVWVVPDGTSGSENLLNWMQARAAEGLAVIFTDPTAAGYSGPVPGDAEPVGLVIATRNIKVASDLTMSDNASIVIIEPSDGWVHPDQPEAKAEVGGSGEGGPNYLLYVGIGAVVLLGAGYMYSRRKR